MYKMHFIQVIYYLLLVKSFSMFLYFLMQSILSIFRKPAWIQLGQKAEKSLGFTIHLDGIGSE
jgi:hypothetical protein